MYKRFCIVSQRQPTTFTEATSRLRRWQEKLIPEDKIWKALSTESKDFIRCPLDSFRMLQMFLD